VVCAASFCCKPLVPTASVCVGTKSSRLHADNLLCVACVCMLFIFVSNMEKYIYLHITECQDRCLIPVVVLCVAV
jgi:hypothetical protein